MQLTDLLNAPNSDDVLRDLTITISQRGVVFFRNQGLTVEQQKVLGSKLAIYNAEREPDYKDSEASTISYDRDKKLYGRTTGKRQSISPGWHSDTTFEPVPSDYVILRIHELPATGGDTLWASGYEVFDRISRPYQKFLESLTATCSQPAFNQAADRNGFKISLSQGARRVWGRI